MQSSDEDDEVVPASSETAGETETNNLKEKR